MTMTTTPKLDAIVQHIDEALASLSHASMATTDAAEPFNSDGSELNNPTPILGCLERARQPLREALGILSACQRGEPTHTMTFALPLQFRETAGRA